MTKLDCYLNTSLAPCVNQRPEYSDPPGVAQRRWTRHI
jgi:hypothetical protein